MLAQDDRKIDAIVHSIAFADFAGHADKLSQASKQAFLQSQHISAYSFLETAQCAIANNMLIPSTRTVQRATRPCTKLPKPSRGWPMRRRRVSRDKPFMSTGDTVI